MSAMLFSADEALERIKRRGKVSRRTSAVVGEVFVEGKRKSFILLALLE